MMKHFSRPLIVFLFLFSTLVSLKGQNIYTYAGNTIWGYYGDGGAASTAQLYNPTGVAVDNAGNVYIADSQNHRIRKVTPSGTITTVAGTGVAGFSGDSGLAINAKLYYPTDITVDALGNLYIADEYNNRIRKINTGGTITTVAGNGINGFAGDSGLAIKAKLNYPRSVAVDAAGNLFISDYYNSRIRKVAASTGSITTYCGTGVYGYDGSGNQRLTVQMSFPHGIDVDAAGNVYFADANNFYIRKIKTDGTVISIAGTGVYGYSGDGGPGYAADIRYTGGLCVTAAGVVYFADRTTSRIRKIENDTIYSVAGIGGGAYWGDGGPALSCYFYHSYDVCISKVTGDYYIADLDNQRIRKVAAGSNTVSTVCGGGTGGYKGDGSSALNAEFNYPTGIDIDAALNVYVADTYNHVIRKITPSGTVTTIAGTGVSGFSGDGGLATAAQLSDPYDVKVDATGNVYIADTYNNRIRMVSTTGSITTVAGSGIGGYGGDNGPPLNAKFNLPWGIALAASGDIFIADYNNDRIRKISSGTITTVAGTGVGGYNGDDTTTATNARINGPKGIDVDAAGNVYFADFYNHRIRKVLTTGTITTIAGSGIWGYSGDGTPAKNATFKNPTSVSVDALGQLYIADNSNHVVRLVNAAGTMTTLAGTSIPGMSGDGGPANVAQLRYPYACAIDASGNVFITDNYNNRVREVCKGSCFVGIEEATLNIAGKELLVYPNPNNGEVTLKSEKNLNLNIINELGQTVQSVRLNETNNYQAKLTGLNTGIYFISDGNGGIKEKIVVIK